MVGTGCRRKAMRNAQERMQGTKARPESDGKNALRSGAVTLAQLESFATLARWRKQAAAEAALGKSQSQISRDLAALERAVGLCLFDRRGRVLTAAGRRLLDYSG
jgi:hypothetical protein